jgi:EPS-associated MarR family transcriptional regulator
MNAMAFDSLSEEVRYRLLTYLEKNPGASQRDVAGALGVSLGKINYCINALIRKGWVKAANFNNSRHKAAYAYLLTPIGIQEKVNATSAFLRQKVAEYDLIAKEIEALQTEIGVIDVAKHSEHS